MTRSVLAIIMICLGIAMLNAKTIPVHSSKDLMNALKQGEQVRVVIHYADCELISDNEVKSYSPNAIGGMEIATWEYFAPMMMGNPQGFMVCSESKLIENPVGDGYVFNYVKLRISDDDKVKLTARYIDSQDMSEQMDEAFHSVINDGKNDGAVFLYIVE